MYSLASSLSSHKGQFCQTKGRFCSSLPWGTQHQNTEKRVPKHQEQLSNTSTFSKTSENKLKRGKGTGIAGSTPIPHTQNCSDSQHWAYTQTMHFPSCWAQSCQTSSSDCLPPPWSLEKKRLQARACAGITANTKSVLWKFGPRIAKCFAGQVSARTFSML